MAENNTLSRSQIDEICRLYDECKNQKEVARRLHHSLKTISKYLIENGRGVGRGGNPQRKITDKQILAGIDAGLTRQQIADRYGVHVENLARRMTRLGVHARRDKSCYSRPKEITNTWHYTPGGENFVNHNCGDNFEFVAYMRRRYKVKCKTCGAVSERAASTIRQKHIKCDECKEREKEQKELQKERINLIRSFYAIKELKTPKTCSFCGSEFYSQYPSKKYCSDKCKARRDNSIKARCKKYGVYCDTTITPRWVFERDGYVCQICGGKCDATDKSWTGYFGAMSPTIDHIKPLAKGGAHIRSNVQCAHAICNSYKRDIFTA